MKTLQCELCSYVQKSVSEDEVINDMRHHIKHAHPNEFHKMNQMPRQDRDKKDQQVKSSIKDVA